MRGTGVGQLNLVFEIGVWCAIWEKENDTHEQLEL